MLRPISSILQEVEKLNHFITMCHCHCHCCSNIFPLTPISYSRDIWRLISEQTDLRLELGNQVASATDHLKPLLFQHTRVKTRWWVELVGWTREDTAKQKKVAHQGTVQPDRVFIDLSWSEAKSNDFQSTSCLIQVKPPFCRIWSDDDWSNRFILAGIDFDFWRLTLIRLFCCLNSK